MTKMVNRYNKCIGITLFRFFRWKIELWITPPNYEIPEHRHPNIDSEIIPLFFGSNVSITRNNKYSSRCFTLSWSNGLFRSFSIRSNDYHYFKNPSSKYFIFINFEKFRKKSKVTSAAVDFEYSPRQQKLCL
jgi:hypothetical protein